MFSWSLGVWNHETEGSRALNWEIGNRVRFWYSFVKFYSVTSNRHLNSNTKRVRVYDFPCFLRCEWIRVGNHWQEMKKPFMFQNVSFQVAQQAEIGRGKGNGIELTDTYMHTHPHTPCILSQHYLRFKGLMLRHVQNCTEKKFFCTECVLRDKNTHHDF